MLSTRFFRLYIQYLQKALTDLSSSPFNGNNLIWSNPFRTDGSDPNVGEQLLEELIYKQSLRIAVYGFTDLSIFRMARLFPSIDGILCFQRSKTPSTFLYCCLFVYKSFLEKNKVTSVVWFHVGILGSIFRESS